MSRLFFSWGNFSDRLRRQSLAASQLRKMTSQVATCHNHTTVTALTRLRATPTPAPLAPESVTSTTQHDPDTTLSRYRRYNIHGDLSHSWTSSCWSTSWITTTPSSRKASNQPHLAVSFSLLLWSETKSQDLPNIKTSKKETESKEAKQGPSSLAGNRNAGCVPVAWRVYQDHWV